MSIKSAVSLYAPTRGIAMILGVGMLIWGLWVLMPFVAMSGPVYEFMISLASEVVWGGLFTFAGITLCAGTWLKDVSWIATGAFLGFALWTTIAVLGVISEPSATPVVTRGIIAAMHAWLYIQIKVHPELVAGTITIQDLRDYKGQN